MTAGMLLGVFALKFKRIDVSDLSVVLPLILAFYTGGNVIQDYVNKKFGNNNSFPSSQKVDKDSNKEKE
jgi:hypothetical protein